MASSSRASPCARATSCRFEPRSQNAFLLPHAMCCLQFWTTPCTWHQSMISNTVEDRVSKRRCSALTSVAAEDTSLTSVGEPPDVSACKVMMLSTVDSKRNHGVRR